MKLVNEEKSWLEWVVFALSSVLLVAVVGYLVYDAIQDKGRPPDIRITLGAPERSAHGFLVPVAVTNLGDDTAQALEIEVGSGSAGQTATLSFDFLASQEVRRGWVGFSGEVAPTLIPRVVGYRSE